MHGLGQPVADPAVAPTTAAATASGRRPTAAPHADAPADADPKAQPLRHRASHLSGWALAFLAALLAGWALWRRSRRLAAEAQRLDIQHRALKCAHSRLRIESMELRQQAINDPLTGTFNRQAFATQLRDMVTHAAHYELPVHLIILDLDHFKSINDSQGHLAGDSALKLVAGIVHEHLRSEDLFGRFGGDEFLIASAGRESDTMRSLAESIRGGVQQASVDHDPPLPGLTLSMGIACAGGEHAYSADALFARADAALYEAKRQGRNRVVAAGEALRGEPTASVHGRHL